ncbi:PHP domain-containing protein [archaeon]|nr:PHP domain-containing protein [archaeon]MBL7057504.1 PHP domain-containing protein [Candidatus Woesearchaeota archaeon]
MLKADLHLHAGEDKCHNIKYSSKDLIDRAASLGFEVLAFTFHDQTSYTEELADYAKKKGILLIPGIEKHIEGKEVLLYNITAEQIKKLKSFADLKELKKKHDILVIAPHPFFKRKNCLDKKLIEHIDLFDGIEYAHFYLSWLNFNKKSVEVAEKFSKPLIGNSDSHYLVQLNTTYSLIDSEKNIKSVFKAIRNKKVVLKTKPVSLFYFIWRTFVVMLDME